MTIAAIMLACRSGKSEQIKHLGDFACQLVSNPIEVLPEVGRCRRFPQVLLAYRERQDKTDSPQRIGFLLVLLLLLSLL